MKNVQIPYELFVDLVLYHLNGEDDFYEEIREGLEQKLDTMLNHSSTLNTKQRPPRNSESRQGRNILTAVECRRAIAGLLFLGSYDRSVPRSCGWQTRQSIG